MAESTYTVTRSATINAAPSVVYEKIVDLAQWESWSPWEGLDPSMEKTYSDSTAGPGASYSWSGNRKVGSGKMTITDVSPDERVDIDLEFLKPFKAQNKTWFTLEGKGQADDGTATEVTWTMTGQNTFMTKVMGLFTSMDKMVGKDFEKGLTQLKAQYD